MATDGQSEPSPGPEDHALDAAIEAAEAGHATVPQRSPGIFERIRIVLVGQSTEPKYDKVQELLLNRPLSTPNISQPWYIRSLFMHYSIYKKRQALFLGKYEEDSLYSFDMLGQHWIVATALPLQSASSSTSRIASTSHPSSAPTSQRLPLPHSDVGNDYISVNETTSRTIVNAGDSFSAWACRFHKRINETCPNTLQLVVLTEQPKPDYHSHLFSSRHKTYATLNRTRKNLHLTPAWLMRHMVLWSWGIPHEDKLPTESFFETYSFERPSPLVPPSRRRKASNINTGFWNPWFNEKNLGKYYDNGDWHETHTYCVTLGWHRHVTPYGSDFVVFTKEPHREKPALEYARILYTPPREEMKQPRMLVLIRSAGSIQRFSTFRRQLIRQLKDFDADPPLQADTQSGPRNAEHISAELGPGVANVRPRPDDAGSETNHAQSNPAETAEARANTTQPGPGETEHWNADEFVMAALYTTFLVMVEETDLFIWQCYKERKKLHHILRQSPSSNKSKYLLHLMDLAKASLHGVSRGLQLLEEIESSSVTANRQQLNYNGAALPRLPKLKGTRMVKLHEQVSGDLHFQKSQTESLLRELSEDQDLLRSRFQLTQDRRFFTLNILAAVFLPLSFTTSLFGMNINSDTKDGPGGLSNWTQSALEKLSSIENRRTTEILSSVTATSGSLTFSWRTFGITAACLLTILPFSFILGASFRAIVGGVALSAIYWRALLLAVVLFIFWVSISGPYVPPLMSLVVNVLLMATSLGLAWRKKKQKRKLAFWLGLSVLFAVDVAVYFHQSPVAFVIVVWLPWITIGLVGLLYVRNFWSYSSQREFCGKERTESSTE